MDDLAARISATPFSGKRRLVAINGPPASGKSTLAGALSEAIPKSAVVPMDGFHLDNAVLDARGLRAVKGAPQTFDAQGFVDLIERLKTDDEVSYPLFDRSQDRAIAEAGSVAAQIETVLVEGNYLLLKTAPWDALSDLWDLTICIDVPEAELERRLLARWTSLGLSQEEAEAKTYGNDLPNARTVLTQSAAADITV